MVKKGSSNRQASVNGLDLEVTEWLSQHAYEVSIKSSVTPFGQRLSLSASVRNYNVDSTRDRRRGTRQKFQAKPY